VSCTDFMQLERVKVADIRKRHRGRQVFVPGAGTVLLGDRPVYGAAVVGDWWALTRMRWVGRLLNDKPPDFEDYPYEITATRLADGHKWRFHPDDHADRILYLETT
jgi:hypothetical protein